MNVSVSVDARGGQLRLVCVTATGVTTPLYLDDMPVASAGVYRDPGSGWCTGADAARRARDCPQRYLADPLAALAAAATVEIDGDEVAVEVPMAALLAWICVEVQAVTGSAPVAAAIVVPADWGPRRYTRIRAAATQAGISETVLVAAPVAAATYATMRAGVSVAVGGLVLVAEPGDELVTCSLLRRTSDIGWDLLSTITRNLQTVPPDADAAPPTAPPDPSSTSASMVDLIDTTAIEVIEAADVDSTGVTATILLDTHNHGGTTHVAGTAAVPVPRPAQAAVVGASFSLHTATRTPDLPVQVRDGFARQMAALLVTWLASLALAVHAMTSADVERNFDHPGFINYVLYNHGELAAACLLAMLAALLTGRTLILNLAARPAAPAAAAGFWLVPARAMLGCTGIGVTVCLIYALLTATVLAVPSGPFLATAAKTAPAAILTGVAITVLLPRLAYLGAGMRRQLRASITATVLATVGIIGGQYGTAQVDVAHAALVNRLAGAAVGAACAWILTCTTTIRLIFVPAAAIIAALATGTGGISLDAVIFVVAAYLALAGQLAGVLIDAYPRTLSRLSRHR